MNPFEMVVLIVLIVAAAKVLRARYQGGRGTDYPRDHLGNDYYSGAPHVEDGEKARLEREVTSLKERIAVLERLATDNHSASELDREIERLRALPSDPGKDR